MILSTPTFDTSEESYPRGWTRFQIAMASVCNLPLASFKMLSGGIYYLKNSAYFGKTTLFGCFLLLLVPSNISPVEAQDIGFERTERRPACAHYNTLKNPYFGDLHVHTSFSFDAALNDTFNDPRKAYRFARGEPLALPDQTGAPTRTLQIDRPLDFAAVTDHAEYFGEIRICTTPGLPGFDSFECEVFRQQIFTDNLVNFVWGLPYIGAPNPAFPEPRRFSFCFDESSDETPANCLTNATDFWQETQVAAEEAYDQSAACSFTTFVGYEWTGTPAGANLHRNVIFRNDQVPELPISYMETADDPRLLWQGLQETCLESGTGCDVLTIPHNSNLSGGLQFRFLSSSVEERAEEAAVRQKFEPLVEIVQHKGASECRTGVGNSDEACGFEQLDLADFATPAPKAASYPANNMVRNLLKEGLAVEQELAVNPYKLGLVGSTDTHNGTPGAVEETTWQGHDGSADAVPATLLQADRIRNNPGGLTVAWAEENSRDAIFSALRNRETYATSGTRPIVRFFGGWKLPPGMCRSPRFANLGYKFGVPMGSDLPPLLPSEQKARGGSRRGPSFAVMAFQDAGTVARPGTALQRIQIIKGWVDEEGKTHEKVFDVAGKAIHEPVDPLNCESTARNFASLCTVWQDPEFNPDESAFYYARVLEQPTCRWSARVCREVGLDPFEPTACRSVLESFPEEEQASLSACCTMSMGPDFDPNPTFSATGERLAPPIPITQQERAWTSPIWFRGQEVD